MGENSKIEWTDHTFNPWIGCAKVAAGCTHCYAEAFAKRYGKAVWGPHGTRVKTSDAYWRKPVKWNREAEAAGERTYILRAGGQRRMTTPTKRQPCARCGCTKKPTPISGKRFQCKQCRAITDGNPNEHGRALHHNPERNAELMEREERR